MGIGGLKTQMSKLIEQVLISRIVNDKLRTEYEVKDIKGILLYGPPGTGKTLIARNIGKIIPNSILKKINGPELSSKYYGETESNIRGIFDEAKYNPDQLYIIIFDEIDAIGRIRGQSNNQIDDKVLTQLLTMIDGLESANNILIIGITNRRDVLDPALIRAGRLECHIEIPLPTEEGRKEILDIYLKPLITKNLIDNNINSEIWSRKLEGYSGADIESLIGRAKNLALLRNCNISEDTIKSSDNEKLSQITNNDLLQAFSEYKPMFSTDELAQKYVQNYPLSELDDITETTFKIASMISQQMKCPGHYHMNVKSELDKAFICHVAMNLNLSYIKFVSYNEFLGKHSLTNCQLLDSIYVNCLQAEKACLILDSISDTRDSGLILRERFIINSPLPPNKQLIIITLSNE